MSIPLLENFSGSAWWRIRHQLHQKLWSFGTFPQIEKTPDLLALKRLVGRQSEIRDQTSDTQTSALSRQLMDLDRVSDDRCIFASLLLSRISSQLLLSVLWAGKVIVSVKCVVPIATLGGISLRDMIPGFLF